MTGETDLSTGRGGRAEESDDVTVEAFHGGRERHPETDSRRQGNGQDQRQEIHSAGSGTDARRRQGSGQVHPSAVGTVRTGRFRLSVLQKNSRLQ